MVLRLLWTLTNPKPISLNPYGGERFAERSVHWFLYIAVISMPIAGWVGTSSGGKPPHLGNFVLSLPIQKNKALIDTAFDVHNTLAIVIIVLFSLHFLAALYHHFIKKDNTLRRML
jgi:cytochrome b561